MENPAPFVNKFAEASARRGIVRATESKLPSDHYEICVMKRWPGVAGLSSGEFTVTAYGLDAATAHLESLKYEALAIYLMRLTRGGERIKEPAGFWYATDYKGKRR